MERLRISDNGRYFVKADGTPFTWLADTTWTMPQRLKWDDAEYLMEKRKTQGFTMIQIVALDPERDIEMRNPSGEKALIDNDLSKPNDKYFSYLDWIIKRAEELDLYVLLLPVWGQLVVGEDWGGNTYEKTVNEDNAYGYGLYIGERYKDAPNVIWCLGGDRQPIHNGVDYRNVWRRMAEGLGKGLTGKDMAYNDPDAGWKDLLITYHACHESGTGECSSFSYFDEDEAWIRFTMLQSGHGVIPKNYEIVEKEYNRATVRPVWDGEPAYEEMPTGWPPTDDKRHGTWMVRKRAYWSLLSGSFGHTYGHCVVWCSIGFRELNMMNLRTWYDAIESEGSYQMKHLRAAMEDLALATFVPATKAVISQDGSEEMNLHVSMSQQPEGSALCAYLPSGGSMTVDMEQLPVQISAEKMYAWWWNPADGKYYDASNSECTEAVEISIEKTMTFTAPTQGDENDWILVLTKEALSPIGSHEYYDLAAATAERKVFVW